MTSLFGTSQPFDNRWICSAPPRLLPGTMVPPSASLLFFRQHIPFFASLLQFSQMEYLFQRPMDPSRYTLLVPMEWWQNPTVDHQWFSILMTSITAAQQFVSSTLLRGTFRIFDFQSSGSQKIFLPYTDTSFVQTECDTQGTVHFLFDDRRSGLLTNADLVFPDGLIHLVDTHHEFLPSFACLSFPSC